MPDERRPHPAPPMQPARPSRPARPSHELPGEGEEETPDEGEPHPDQELPEPVPPAQPKH
jgi:hypothetical protein